MQCAFQFERECRPSQGRTQARLIREGLQYVVTLDRRIDALQQHAGRAHAALEEAALEHARLDLWLCTAAKLWPEFASKLEPLRRASAAVAAALEAHSR